MRHTDRMDSFVLAETFKYFYLLFSKPSDLPIDLEQYVLTTEAHILPIGLPKRHPPVGVQVEAPVAVEEEAMGGSYGRVWGGTCAAANKSSTLHRLLHANRRTAVCHASLWRRHNRLEAIRRPLRSMAKIRRVEHMADDVGSGANSLPPSLLSPSAVNTANLTHLQILRQMGIMVLVGRNGEIQLRLNRSEVWHCFLPLTRIKPIVRS